jgi:hypothetical protein
MKRLFAPALLLFVFWSFSLESASAQTECVFSVNMVNHARYVYETDSECLSFEPFHTVPFGNFGVTSNVGHKQDANQFQGWNPSCNPGPGTLVEWNGCSVEYAKPDLDCRRLNFPNPAGTYPYPTNGYPFTDSYSWNDNVPLVGGSATCVDQYSPCGPNTYGFAGTRVGVSPRVDYDYDGIPDAGGCKDLDGYQLIMQQNFMTIYELDGSQTDDLVESIYFPNVLVNLTCTPDACFAVGDNNYDGWLDDVGNQASPEYKYPTLYQDEHDVICYPSTPGVPCKRLDAAIRIGRLSSFYTEPTPVCNESERQTCEDVFGRIWNPQTCSCGGYSDE